MSSESTADAVQFHPRFTQRLVGHESAQRLFTEAHALGRLHHAWLLGGVEGLGKATFAHQACRFLLAQQSPESGELLSPSASLFGAGLFESSPENPDNPDKEGDLVKEGILFSQGPKLDPSALSLLLSGGHPDVRVVERTQDEAGRLKKEIGIDQIREVTQFLSLTPAFGGWRVVIIDSADDLNTQAANALLKILEEPPRRSLFMLVSHYPQRLMRTLRSRCQRLDFSPLSPSEIKSFCELILATNYQEKINYINYLAEGRPGLIQGLLHRRGIEIFDHLLSCLKENDFTSGGTCLYFAEEIARRDQPEGWSFFQKFYLQIIKDLSIQAAQGSQTWRGQDVLLPILSEFSGRHSLEYLVDLWDKLSTSFVEAERLNLDKKQIVLSALLALSPQT